MSEYVYTDPVLQEKINRYLELIPSSEIEGNPERILRILRAFKMNPEKAAQKYNDAREKMELVAEAFINEKLAHVQKPISEHFWSHFDTFEEAETYKNDLLEKASYEGGKVFKREFYDYVDQQLEQYEDFIGSC